MRGPESVENNGGTLEEIANHCFSCECVLEHVLELFGSHQGLVLEPKLVRKKLPGGSREGSGRLPGGSWEGSGSQDRSRRLPGRSWGPIGGLLGCLGGPMGPSWSFLEPS